MIAHLRKIRISPKKANLIAEMVRNKTVTHALTLLKFTPKRAAKVLYKVINSARANAENNFKQETGSLMIKEIIVNEGPTYKRFQPVSRGRSHPILKRTSHITVKVEADPNLIKPKTTPAKDSSTEAAVEPAKKPAKRAKKTTS